MKEMGLVGRAKEAPAFRCLLFRRTCRKQRLEAQLSVRGLAAPLPDAAAFVLLKEFYCRRRDRLVDVSTRETAAVGAVPVSLGNHRAPATGADSRQRRFHLLHPPAICYSVRCWSSPSAASEVSCRVRVERLPYSSQTRFTPRSGGSPVPMRVSALFIWAVIPAQVLAAA